MASTNVKKEHFSAQSAASNLAPVRHQRIMVVRRSSSKAVMRVASAGVMSTSSSSSVRQHTMAATVSVVSVTIP